MPSGLPVDCAVAIVLHGPGDAHEVTAASLFRHVVEPLRACVFYAAPQAQRDGSAASAHGRDDMRNLSPGAATTGSTFRQGHLTIYEVRDDTVADALAGGVARLVAEMGGIEQGLRLMRAHERAVGRSFDQVLIVRTDRVFYSSIIPSTRDGVIETLSGEGFDRSTGRPLADLPPLRYYRNRATGDFIPDDGSVRFGDGAIALSRGDVALLDDLAIATRTCLDEGVPSHAATILYLLLIARGRLAIRRRPDWIVETYRSGDPTVINGTTLASSGTPMAGRRRRVAVLLYGLLREYGVTAGSLLRHVVEPHAASVFYFGPRHSDNPTRDHGGKFDEHGFFTFNPKGEFEEIAGQAAPDLAAVYGKCLKAFQFHDLPQRYFLEVANEVCPREDWLFMLSPHRLLSMFYSLAGVIELLRDHEAETGEPFDEVILTRPDLAFYAPVIADVQSGEVHIPASYDFDANGYPHQGNAPVFFYKNVMDGTYLPAGRHLQFNDQVLYLRRSDLDRLGNVYDRLLTALRQRVPASPETILYMIVAVQGGLRVVDHEDWRHEIYRAGDPIYKNVADTLEILRIDPRHHRAARFRASDGSPPPGSARVGDGGRHLVARMLLPDGVPSMSRWRRLLQRRVLRRARASRRQGDLAKAQHLYARFLRAAPHVQREWVQFGHILKDQGDLAGARAAYDMASDLAPGDPDPETHRKAIDRIMTGEDFPT